MKMIMKVMNYYFSCSERGHSKDVHNVVRSINWSDLEMNIVLRWIIIWVVLIPMIWLKWVRLICGLWWVLWNMVHIMIIHNLKLHQIWFIPWLTLMNMIDYWLIQHSEWKEHKLLRELLRLTIIPWEILKENSLRKMVPWENSQSIRLIIPPWLMLKKLSLNWTEDSDRFKNSTPENSWTEKITREENKEWISWSKRDGKIATPSI